ncbi:hypothetical protein BH11ACT5_BH11ACT5_19220 [soil metagenome]
MTAQIRMLGVGVIVPLIIAAVALVLMLLTLPTLPDPVAVHWGPSGQADAFGTPVGAILVVGIGVLAYSALGFALARSRGSVNSRIALAVGPFLATVLGVISAGGLLLQRGLADAHDTPSILPVVALGFGAGVLLAVVSWFVLPAPAPIDPLGDLPTLDLGADERATWFARLEPARWLGVMLAIVAVVVVVGGGVAVWIAGSIPVLIVYLVIMAFVVLASVGALFWTVRIDSRGFTARSVLGVPRFTVPIENVEAAASVPSGATGGFGGWGLRWGGPGRVGIILGSGEALEVHKRDGGAIVVTTADSERAAALLNSLARRA